MSDDAFDDLERRLRKVAPDHAVLKQVGAAANSLAPVKHVTRMGSLDNAFTVEEIEAWITRVEKRLDSRVTVKYLILSPKVDGLSLQLSYRKGKLIQAATRGDGFTGEDVTVNALVAGVPAQIAAGANVDVRGEMVIPKSVFAAKLIHEGYTNERAAAAGILRSKDSKLAKYLRFLAFDANWVSDGPLSPAAPDEFCVQSGVLGWLATAFTVVPWIKIPFSLGRLVKAWEHALEEKMKLEYHADGMVARINSNKAFEGLGWSDTCPRGALACKWRGQMVAETMVVGVENSVGRTGKITPVVILDPVECGGVKVHRASLMNWDEVGRLGKIGNGSRVRIERAGEVIPRVTAVLSEAADPFTRPEDCPSCGAETFVVGPHQVCRNPECPAQTFRTILHWTKSLDIKHLGEETIDRLMSLDGPVATIADLYEITHDQLKASCGRSNVMAEKVARELEKSRDITPAKLLGSISIKTIGVVEADKVVAAFAGTNLAGLDTYRKVMDAWECPDVIARALGPVKGAKFHDGLIANKALLKRLYKLLRVTAPAAKKAVEGSSWNGETFCITGQTEIPRNGLIRIIEAAGGTWKSSVVNGLDYLITNDTDSGSKKNAEAVKKGVTVITEQTALDMAGYK
jgi:DNA ligase (NAD+)